MVVSATVETESFPTLALDPHGSRHLQSHCPPTSRARTPPHLPVLLHEDVCDEQPVLVDHGRVRHHLLDHAVLHDRGTAVAGTLDRAAAGSLLHDLVGEVAAPAGGAVAVAAVQADRAAIEVLRRLAANVAVGGGGGDGLARRLQTSMAEHVGLAPAVEHLL